MFTTRPELAGTYGMVASTHWLASQAGMRILEDGGNAFDAAVAAGFVLQVVEPHLNGPGGEVPIIASTADGDVQVVAGQGPAPQAATVKHFNDLELDLVPGTGLLPACVPGAFDAWMRLLAERGTKTVREVLEVAIELAGGGFPLVPRISNTIDTVQQLFSDEWTTSASTWLIDGKTPAPGTRFKLPQLAATYQRIIEDAEAAGSDRDTQIAAARRAWSQGFVAEAIAEWSATQRVMDTSGRRHGGLLTGDDLAEYTAPVEDPLTFDYGEYRLAKTGPWGQGPVFLQQLALLQGYDLGSLDPVGPEFVHLVTEAAKLAFADREAWYGDPQFTDVPMGTLLSGAYNAERRALISDAASFELRPGSPEGRQPELLDPPKVGVGDGTGGLLGGAGEPTIAPTGQVSGDTCHVDVVDRWGNQVSATPSGGWLQSSPTIPELGFCLGTRGQMFWLTPGLPASLEPGKRPRTTLTPSLALRDGAPAIAFGTPGGDQQDQWSLTFFLRLAHHGLNLAEAIDMPMFHTMHMPSSFYPRDAYPGQVRVEGRLPQATIAALREQGHEVVVDDDWALGRLSAVKADPATGMLYAAANPRGMQGYAVGR